MIKKNTFESVKFNFSITKVVDGRLNKEKAMGYFCKDFSSVKEFIGSDSLCDELNTFFKANPSSFYQATKIILVINQINIKEIKNSDRDDFEFALSYDYYKTDGNKAVLYYQQYYIYTGSVKLSKSKAINRVFSEAMMFAFVDFQNKAPLFKQTSLTENDTLTLYTLSKNKPDQVLNKQNIKDGIYFSGKDLYLNNPISLANYTIPDTSDMKMRRVTLKSSACPIANAYAVVKYGRIFIYVTDRYYKEAQLSSDGKLYFPNVTRTNISSGARNSSMAVGILSAILPIGFLGSIASSSAQSSIENSGTTTATSNVLVDFESGLWTID